MNKIQFMNCICHPTHIATCKTYGEQFDKSNFLRHRTSHEHTSWKYHCLSPGIKRQIYNNFSNAQKFLEVFPDCNIIARRGSWFTYGNTSQAGSQDYTCFCIICGVTTLRMPPDTCL